MSASGAKSDSPCPVCSQHTDNEQNEAEGLVLTGVKSILEGESETVNLLQEQLGPFEAHTAISMMAGCIVLFCNILHADPLQLLQTLRDGVDHRLAGDVSEA